MKTVLTTLILLAGASTYAQALPKYKVACEVYSVTSESNGRPQTTLVPGSNRSAEFEMNSGIVLDYTFSTRSQEKVRIHANVSAVGVPGQFENANGRIGIGFIENTKQGLVEKSIDMWFPTAQNQPENTSNREVTFDLSVAEDLYEVHCGLGRK